MQTAALVALGLSWSYQAIRAPAGELADALERMQSLGYQGVNVTLPLKEEAFGWAQDIDEYSRSYNALNTLRLSLRKEGTNTDAPAFASRLVALGIPSDARVLLIGAGGTARALARILVATERSLCIWNRTRTRAETLAAESGARVVDELAFAEYDLVVDASSAALAGATLPIVWDGARCAVFQAAYSRTPSALLREAEARGLRAEDGREMLIEQGALALEWWLGREAPRAAMRRALL
jgi:shikimate dehydrogenase